MSSQIDLTTQTYLLQYYATIFMGIVGFITNSLNIAVSTRKEIQKTTMGFYNIILSAFNILAISAKILQTFPSLGLADLTLLSDIGCRLLPYMARVTLQGSTWIYVLISFDRLLLMSYTNMTAYNNRSFSQKNSKKIAKLILLLISIICIMNAPNLLFNLKSQEAINNGSNQTTFILECTANPLITTIRDVLSSAFRVFLPAVILFVVSVILVYKLLRLRINVTTISIKREYKFTFTIVILDLVFVFSDLLILFGLIFINIHGYNQTYISTKSNASALASFFYQCTVLFGLFVTTALLFFINLITNAKFRREAKKIFYILPDLS